MKDTLRPGLSYQLRFKIPQTKIPEGTHERTVIDGARFSGRIADKAREALMPGLPHVNGDPLVTV